jgi:hypothetical protein
VLQLALDARLLIGEIVQQPFGLDRAEIPQPLFAEVRLEPLTGTSFFDGLAHLGTPSRSSFTR